MIRTSSILAVCLTIALVVAAIPSIVKSAPVTEDSLSLGEDLSNSTMSSGTTTMPANEILISALDEENFGNFTGSQLRYDQATTEPSSQIVAVKPEPRNNLDYENQQQQQQQQDQLIIDHRPPIVATNEAVKTQGPATTSSSTTTTQQPMVSQQSPVSSQQQQQQQALPVSNSWNQMHTTQVQQQQPQLYQPIQQYGGQQLAMAPSNQMVTIQHPTSINSIINDQQQQQQQYQISNTNQLVTSATQQPQLMAVQGQAGGAPVLVLNPQPGTLQGGRRISISGWLKGFSNMLANIFNRRDLHANQMMQTAGQPVAASGPSGHWIQLGPNAPHWLTQAQSAIQQFQQGSSQFGNSPTNTMLSAASGNRYTFLASPSTSTVSLHHQQQQQPAQMPPSTTSYLGGDLQASGSAPQQSISVVVPAPQYQMHTPLAAPHQQQASLTIAATPGGQQTLRLQPGNTQQVATNTAANHHPAHRSGRSPPSRQQNHQIVSSTQSPIQSTTTTSTTTMATAPATSTSSQTFPLAHYGRYSD